MCESKTSFNRSTRQVYPPWVEACAQSRVSPARRVKTAGDTQKPSRSVGLLQPAPHMPPAPVADVRATPPARKHGKLSSSGATKSPKSPGSSSRAKPKKKIKKKKAQLRETPRAEGEPDALVDEVDDDEESEEEEGDEEIEAVVEEGVAASADDEALLHEPPADEPLTRSEKKKAMAVAKAMGSDHEAAVAAAKQKESRSLSRSR